MRYMGLSATVVASFLLAGCGPSSPDYPDTVPVRGTVLLDGEPVEGADVAFVPSGGAEAAGAGAQGNGTDEEGTFSAGGRTDASGEFELVTRFSPSHEAAGAVPGDYKVIVTKAGGGSEEEIPTEASVEELDKMRLISKEKATELESKRARNQLPSRYRNPGESPLTAAVSAGDSNEFTFELRSGE